MKIISVIPITKNSPVNELSYLYGGNIEIGQIIEVPIRRKTEKAIVKEIKNIEDQKFDIKSADFELKKIPSTAKLYKTKLPSYFIESLKSIALFFAKPEGSVLKKFLSEEFLEKEISFEEKGAKGQFEVLAISSLTAERIDTYKSLIREAFAKKESVVVILPTEFLRDTIFEQLKKGIEKYTLLFDDQNKKKCKEFLKIYKEETHPLLIVSKDKILSMLRDDVKTIIVEEESSRFFKDSKPPYLDSRIVAEIIAKNKKIKIIFGDTILSIPTHMRLKDCEINSYGNILSKIHHPIKTITIDQKSRDESEGFKILSSELKEMIDYGFKKDKKVFIFTSRKGLSPHTLCRDCGTVVLCEKCESPLVLYKKKNDDTHNFFICHHCGTKKSAHIKCGHCDSVQLQSFGFGTQKLFDEILKITGKNPFVIDSDETNTENKIKKTLEKWRKEKGILIGTEMTLDYLEKEEADYSAISSIDSLLSIPDISIGERVFRIITKTKLIANDCFLLQGRNIKMTLIDNAISGDASTFVREELEIRKKFLLPPFAKMIKITIVGEKEKIRKETETLFEYFKEWNPFSFPAFIKTIRGQTLSHIIIKVAENQKLDDILLSKLLSLPPYIRVKINPESLI